jgi:hypothetical protein
MDAGEAYEGTQISLNSTDYKVEPTFAEKQLYKEVDKKNCYEENE